MATKLQTKIKPTTRVTVALAAAKVNRNTISGLTTLLGQLNADKLSLQTQLSNAEALLAATVDPVQIGNYLTTIAGLKAKLAAVDAKINSNNAALAALKNPTLNSQGTINNFMATPAVGSLIKTSGNLVEYNVGSVNEAYFSTTANFMDESAGFVKNVSALRNTPSSVSGAASLWTDNLGNKGMIQTWNQPGGSVSATNKVPSVGQTYQLPPHGFQFQYNPTTVGMTYSGTPTVDMAYEASGQDAFNFTGTGTTQSTIGFQILINRVYDMKYYDPNSGKLKAGLPSNLYSPRQPSAQEQLDIYNKGTMYDVEFLLRTLMGFTMDSYLRGEKTADMGFVTAIPVELHLGNKLRYLVLVTQIDLNHVLFNERMVPLFTQVNISCSRMPDFGSLNPAVDPKTGKAATTPAPTVVNGQTRLFNQWGTGVAQ